MKLMDRAFYSGSPERDRFKHQGRGICLAATIAGPGAVPQIDEVETGRFDWSEVELHLTPEQDATQALAAVLPKTGAGRRDTLIRMLATGWVRLPERMALEMAIEHALPEFAHFEFSDRELMTECVAEDLDEIAAGGALPVAAEGLYEDARKDGRTILIGASQMPRSAGSTASYGDRRNEDPCNSSRKCPPFRRPRGDSGHWRRAECPHGSQ